jgi:hypothetical protein
LTLSRKEAAERGAVVDELGKIHAKLAAMKPQLDRAKHLEAVIESWFPDLKPEESATTRGHKFVAVISTQGYKRSVISMEAVYKRFGHKAFIDQCGFGLGTLGEMLEPEELPDFIATERAGNRSIKTFTA